LLWQRPLFSCHVGMVYGSRVKAFPSFFFLLSSFSLPRNFPWRFLFLALLLYLFTYPLFRRRSRIISPSVASFMFDYVYSSNLFDFTSLCRRLHTTFGLCKRTHKDCFTVIAIFYPLSTFLSLEVPSAFPDD
jgi:hypothetical protein